MAKPLTATISLRDRYSGVMRKASTETKAFGTAVETARRRIEAIAKQKKEIKMKMFLDKSGINSAIEKMRASKAYRVAVDVVARTQIALSKIKSVFETGKNLARKPIELMLKVKDFASPVLSKISSAVKALGVAAAVATGFGVKGAMDLERQTIAMEHFIGIQNKGMKQPEVAAKTQEYIKFLRQNANATPFATSEVMTAGTRALTVTGGNTQQAQRVLKIAEDMAALNPEKSLSDAMEALADLRVGETERMKEFGFKISQADIKKAGGAENVLNNQIAPFFNGGADKLSNSAAGRISTIQGTIENITTNIGTRLLEKGTAPLAKLVDWVSANEERITNGAVSIVNSVLTVIQGMQPILNQIMTAIAPIVQNYIPLAQKAFSVWGGIAMQLWTQVLQPMFSWIGSQMPTFTNAAITVIQKIAPIFSQIVNIAGVLWKTFVALWPVITSVIQTAWGIISPILDIFLVALKGIVLVLKILKPVATVVFSALWAIMKPFVSLFKLILEGIAGVSKFVGKGITIVSDAIDPGTKPKPHAVGLPYVPRDNYQATLHQGERVLTKQENMSFNKGKASQVNITGNNFYVREEADIDKIASAIAFKLEFAAANG